jgi:hypothetical protein
MTPVTRVGRAALSAIVVLALPACSSSPKIPGTHVVVPAKASVPQMQKLSKLDGATASVITVSGDERVLIVQPGADGVLQGKSLDAETAGRDVSLPFETLALIYYTDPSSADVPLEHKLPLKWTYPKLGAVSGEESELSCDALDVELSRAEALRWFAREQGGALPLSAEEQHTLQAKHAAFNTGMGALALLVLPVALPRVFGDCLGNLVLEGKCVDDNPDPGGVWNVNQETLRWAVTGADERIEGLLQFKEQKQCAGRPTLDPAANDMQLWTLESHQGGGAVAGSDEFARLAERTATFDRLGPKAVSVPMADETEEQRVAYAAWDAYGKPERGVLVLTDKSVVFSTGPRDVPLWALRPEHQIAYVNIATATVEKSTAWPGLKAVTITERDGQVDHILCTRNGYHVVDPAQMESVAQSIQAKLTPVATTGVPQ